MLPRICNACLVALRSRQLGTGEVAQFGEVPGTGVCQIMMLSNATRGIRAGSTPVHRAAGTSVGCRCPGSDILAHQPAATRMGPIPDYRQRPVAERPPQRSEEGDDLGRPTASRTNLKWMRTAPITRRINQHTPAVDKVLLHNRSFPSRLASGLAPKGTPGLAVSEGFCRRDSMC
jgi:hypothetical protein